MKVQEKSSPESMLCIRDLSLGEAFRLVDKIKAKMGLMIKTDWDDALDGNDEDRPCCAVSLQTGKHNIYSTNTIVIRVNAKVVEE